MELIEALDKENNSLDKQTNILSRVLLFWSGVGAGAISYLTVYKSNIFISIVMIIGLLLAILKLGKILKEFRIIYDKIKFNNQNIEDLIKELKNG